MTPPFWTKVAILIALLANGPAHAQSISQHMAANAARIANPLAEATIVAGTSAAHIVGPVLEPINTAGANVAGNGETTAIKFTALVKPPRVLLESHTDLIRRFLHTTTVEPLMRVARGAGEWIASGANTAAIAAKQTSDWIASGSTCVVSAARNTSNWIASSSGAAVLALEDTSRWVEAKASAAWNTSEWIATSPSAAVSLAIGAASDTLSGLSIMEDWSINLVKQVEKHLRADDASEFASLLRESGFALTDVKVGVGIIPELSVEFRHERDLTPAEIQAFKAKVDAYTKTAPGPVGYFEALLLRRLLKAGEYSGGLRISEVHIEVFPLPGLKVLFDPFNFEQEQNKMLVDAYGMAQSERADLKTIEERVSKIETMLSAPRNKK